MRNVKLVLEYEGTNYVGWQRQRQPNSIQQTVEEAIARVTGEHVVTRAASRTDAGVHARGQVINFRTRSTLPCERLRDALNAYLPRDISVRFATDVPLDFDARYAAKAKCYEYTIATGPARPAIDRNFCWHVRSPLDRAAMRAAAAHLVGTHDFAAFGSETYRKRSTVRTLYELSVHEEGERLRIRARGDGFLYNMVRAIVGTLVDVGRGKITPDDVVHILATHDRRRAGRTAPARGLCLMSVEYESDS